MAKEKQQTILEENTSEIPSDRELFTADIHGDDPKADLSSPKVNEELSERDVFVGDEEFDATRLSSLLTGYKRFSIVQKVLAISIVVIAAMLLCALLMSPSEPVAGPAPPLPTNEEIPAVQQTFRPEPQIKDSTLQVTQRIPKSEPVLAPAQPQSLNIAETLYLQSSNKR
jgi:hypothetical protein